jgi:galactokinase
MVEDTHSVPILSKAPGRVEVLGNHTDYNGGLVLASPINRFIWGLGVKSEDARIHSIDFMETSNFDPKQVGPIIHESWDKYPKGVFWALTERGFSTQGVTSVICGDVQIGAGLSSSAALEVAFTNLVIELNEIEVDLKTRALIAYEAERNYCQISCGIMDQFTSQLGKANSLLSIDCANLETTEVPINPEMKLLVVDSMVKRSASDALNQRRKECQEATTVLREAGWKIQNLSDVSTTQIDDAYKELDDILSSRVQHIVNENARVRKAITYLKNDEIHKFGNLMYESHESSRDLYEVSHPRLDILVEMTRKLDGVVGSRMTGAGFGGAILCLIKADFADVIAKRINHEYEMETGEKPTTILCEIPDGVQTQKIDSHQIWKST